MGYEYRVLIVISPLQSTMNARMMVIMEYVKDMTPNAHIQGNKETLN